MKRNALVAALPALMLLGGCPVYFNESDDSGHCVGSGCDGTVDECDSDLDCGEGYICESDQCLPGSRTQTCVTHGDCDAGEYCSATTLECTPSGSCTSDGDCASGFECDFRNTCVPTETGHCYDTSDCTSGQACVENVCRNLEDVCQFTYQCAGSEEVCVDNHCTGICTEDSECGSGQHCLNSYCVADPTECTSTDQCSGGAHCVDGRCLVGCASSAECSSGEVCGEDSFCRPAWAPSPFCDDNSDCREGHVCHMGACRTPCPTGTADECQRFDSQLTVCANDNLCYSDNETMPECATAIECSGGDMCVDASCL